MKTWKLLLLSLVPGIVGYAVNLTILLPAIGTAIFSLQGLVIAAFSIWLGTQCAKSGRRFPAALLLTQWPSVVCFVLYLWQFHICSEETRSLFWAVLSQMPSEPLFFYAARLVTPFADHSWGPPETLAAHGISLLLLAALFSCGYAWQRHRISTSGVKA